ncbi:hypothetical protein [Oceanidesulfovibrio indonesiensis]|uniref:hypothetical protein n=1 Tax=Oceanidesulfovibrio indonesiensis TaxID=54767 RepID=UPI001F255E85|nr:hypothetical protein [Oceanidesulfovibrio indonesiensis]
MQKLLLGARRLKHLAPAAFAAWLRLERGRPHNWGTKMQEFSAPSNISRHFALWLGPALTRAKVDHYMWAMHLPPGTPPQWLKWPQSKIAVFERASSDFSDKHRHCHTLLLSSLR